MGTLKEDAQAYEPKQTKNISELERVPVDIELVDDEFTVEEDGKERVVKQKIIDVDGEEYRVPVSVISSLKEHLDENPDLKFFKVRKSGEGMKTRYTVIPVSGEEGESPSDTSEKISKEDYDTKITQMSKLLEEGKLTQDGFDMAKEQLDKQVEE